VRTASASLLAIVFAAACGGDDAGEPGGRPPAEALDPVPRAWSAGSGLGYALLNVPRKDPVTLAEPTCTVDGQLVNAATDGTLESTDRDGVCMVTRDLDWLGTVDSFTPACAGVLDYELGMGLRTTVCDRVTDPLEIDCGAAGGAASFRVSSAPDEIMGDVLGALDLTVMDPGRPVITEPETQGEGTALWPDGGNLRLAWEGTAADAIEIVIGQTTGTGPLVRCYSADDGVFVVPGRLLDAYRSGTAFVEIAAITQERDVPDGFAFRATFRKSDAIWLFRR
jgi:hypothetical protein